MRLHRSYEKYYGLGSFRIPGKHLTGNPHIDLSDPGVRDRFLYFLSRRCVECEKNLYRFAKLRGMDVKDLYSLRRAYNRGKREGIDPCMRRLFTLLTLLTSRDEETKERARKGLSLLFRQLKKMAKMEQRVENGNED